MEQLKTSINQHYDKPVNLVELVIPICYQVNLSVTQLFLEDLNTLGQTIIDNFHLDYKIS